MAHRQKRDAGEKMTPAPVWWGVAFGVGGTTAALPICWRYAMCKASLTKPRPRSLGTMCKARLTNVDIRFPVQSVSDRDYVQDALEKC